MAPVIGQPAPDFSLPSTAGKDVTLSSFRGDSSVLFSRRAYFLVDQAGTLRWAHTETE